MIDQSSENSCDNASELLVWGTHKQGGQIKLFGSIEVAKLNWYPEEGCDLVCLKVVKRVRKKIVEFVEVIDSTK